MKISVKPMGPYQTNCYIVNINNKDIIIDPGVDATAWVIENVKNPIAILNTHGHFDHVWSNQELKERLNIPLYAPKEDLFMLKKSTLMPDLPPSYPDFEVLGDAQLLIDSVDVHFRHFPGHSPGCSTIEIGDAMFSGDFIFNGSIGRCDLPFSEPEDMKRSLKRFKNIAYNKKVYPGHGSKTTIKAEQANVDYWINVI